MLLTAGVLVPGVALTVVAAVDEGDPDIPGTPGGGIGGLGCPIGINGGRANGGIAGGIPGGIPNGGIGRGGKLGGGNPLPGNTDGVPVVCLKIIENKVI